MLVHEIEKVPDKEKGITGCGVKLTTFKDFIKEAEVTHELEDVKDGKRRKYTYEIENYLYCPVIGTCLGLEEQRRILKKTGISVVNVSPYVMHSRLVQSLHSKNPLSLRINNYLNRKYRREIDTYGELTEREFLSVWKEKMRAGDINGIFWVAVTHPDLSPEIRQTIFGDVHMLSHLNGGEIRKELREANILREKNQELSEKLWMIEKEYKKRLKEQKEELESFGKSHLEIIRKSEILEKEKNDLARELRRLQSDKYIDELNFTIQELRTQLDQVQRKFEENLNALSSLKEENAKLRLNLSAQVEINEQLQGEVERMPYQAINPEPYDKGSLECNLCGKRVLIVGGMTKLAGFYRNLIEKMGGIFEYHDGYFHNGTKALYGLVERADIVLCPVDCNSHNACLCIKKICKKLNKQYHMLPGSSLSNISRALLTLSQEKGGCI